MLGTLPPFLLRAIGLTGGALLLLAFAALTRRRLLPPKDAWPAVAIGGLLTIAAFNFCTAFAQLATTTSRAAVLTYTMPMLAALLGWVWLGERPTRRIVLALVLGTAGIALLAWPVLAPASGSAAVPRPSTAGLVLPLLAAAAWALGTVANKRVPLVGDRVVLTAWQLAIGGALGIVAALAAGDRWPDTWPPRAIGALVFHVVLANAVAYVIWYRLLETLSATVSSLTTLAVPVVGVLGAMALVGDRPTALDAIGFVLVLGGAALAVLRIGRG